MRCSWLVVAWGFLGGCGDSGASGDVADTSPIADTADTADGADTTPSEGPIVERGSTDRFACHESLAPTQPAVKNWSAAATVVANGRTWALQTGDQKLYLGAVGADAKLGTRWELPTQSWSVASAAALADGAIVTLVWSEYQDAGGQVLRHARVDVDEGIVTAPHDLASSSSFGTVGLARNDGVTGLVWSEASGGSEGVVRYARLDADGFDGTPTELGRGADPSTSGAAITGRGAGFAVSWSKPATGDATAYELWLQAIDAAGTPQGAAARVSPEATAGHSFGSGWNQGARPMLAVGDELWIAYTETWSNGDFMNQHGATDLFVAVVTADGSIARHPVNRSVVDQNSTQASLFAYGSAVGLTWTAGTAIYICAGCYVDYDLHVLLIDPTTMTPAAPVVVHTHNAHGYSRPRTTVVGDAVMTLAWQDFHALGYPAVAITTCTER